MKIIKVLGVNGLGKTAGTVEAGQKLFDFLEGDKFEIEIDNDNVEEQLEVIEKKCVKYIGNERVLFIGGDHSISYPLTKSFFNKYQEGCLVVFDAHADTMEPMKEPTHEEWLRGVVDDCGLSGDQVLLIGTRKIEPQEAKYLDETGIKVLEELDFDKIKEFIDGRDCYVSFDVDVFDPSVVSATGCAVKDGFSKEEGINIIKEIVELESIRVFDVIELNVSCKGFNESLDVVEELIGEIVKKTFI